MRIRQNLVPDPDIMNSNREYGDCMLANSNRQILKRNSGTSNYTQIGVRMIKVVKST